MAFDQATRNRLARFVSDARNLLTEEFTRQLQHEYGLDPASGTVTPPEKLTALDDTRWETASILRETMAYYLEGKSGTSRERKAVLDRILREQAFTVLNRICALRLAEARGLILQAVGGGYQSQGFQLYARLAGPALGETGEVYRSYLFSLFDEMAVELPPLFDRYNPEGRLFPRPTALLALLNLINDPELEILWGEDETIGWIYQYFNSQEERKAMRAASQAPRNSRELAVRNQFFTPRYVVEFLTDNTLGRIWYEMTKGDTALIDTCAYLVRRPTEIFLDEGVKAPEQETSDEELSQEELLRQPVYIPYRQLKDPREIKMLDPACGSMHFGLYAFDLFEQIYIEAWDLEERLGEGALWRLELKSLHETYPDKVAFLQDVPRLIIEYNIHGIDIDPRAVQIAGLSLWLRAHKSWGNAGVSQAERPKIRKSNIVCAEPMPGDQNMLDDFLTTLDEARLEDFFRKIIFSPAESHLRITKAMADALVDLVRTVWVEMELAGEAGSLLKIDETLREAIANARKVSAEKSPLFRVLEYDLGSASNHKSLDFWNFADQLVLFALKDYASRNVGTNGFQRRLFTDDATQGFAFIELCRNRYDVVLMNPPFGAKASSSARVIEEKWKHGAYDLATSFVMLAREYTDFRGGVGVIMTRTPFFLSRYSEWRKESLFDEKQPLNVFVDLGQGVLDSAMVEAVLAVFSNQKTTPVAFDYSSKGGDYLLPDEFSSNNALTFSLENLQFVPNSPLAYWVPYSTLEKFNRYFSYSEKADVKQGLATRDNERFVRLWWEVDSKQLGNKKWRTYAKGGEYRRYYLPLHLIVDWSEPAQRVYKMRTGQMVVLLTKKKDKYLTQVGLTYSKRSQLGFSARIMPKGTIFSPNGPGVFPKTTASLYYDLAFLNSAFSRACLEFLTSFGSYSEGYVGALAYNPPSDELLASINTLTKECVTKTRSIFNKNEIYREFLGFDLTKNSITEIADTLGYSQLSLKTKLAETIENLDLLIQTNMSLNAADKKFAKEYAFDRNIEDEDSICSIVEFTQKIIMYIMGCVIGRWDIRNATREIAHLDQSDPFAPLPVSPLGMLQNTHGLPATPQDVPQAYPLRVSWTGILTDDPGHSEDIISRTRDVLHAVWGKRSEMIEAEACEILGVGSLREYFQRTNLFFDDHLKRYSKSRRYAPIYWPLSTPSGSYTLWLYYHRIDNQILFTCVNDFVDPKLKQVGEDLVRLRQKSGRSRDEESELEHLNDLNRELKDFRTELLRVAGFWKPNLNDGVQITASPLWRLFQHRTWQNRLRDTWEKLEAGEYDWAHLAYSIWPERVREKCKTDKSLAIAHDLEHLYVDPPKKPKSKKAGQAKMEGFLNE